MLAVLTIGGDRIVAVVSVVVRVRVAVIVDITDVVGVVGVGRTNKHNSGTLSLSPSGVKTFFLLTVPSVPV